MLCKLLNNYITINFMRTTGEKSYVLRVGIKTMFCGLNKSHLAAITYYNVHEKNGVIILLSVGTGVYIQLVSISSLAVNLTAMISICLMIFSVFFFQLFHNYYSKDIIVGSIVFNDHCKKKNNSKTH